MPNRHGILYFDLLLSLSLLCLLLLGWAQQRLAWCQRERRARAEVMASFLGHGFLSELAHSRSRKNRPRKDFDRIQGIQTLCRTLPASLRTRVLRQFQGWSIELRRSSEPRHLLLRGPLYRSKLYLPILPEIP